MYLFKLLILFYHFFYYSNGDWGIGDWGLGIGDWAQSPIPNPQSPIPNPHAICNLFKIWPINISIYQFILIKDYI